ncbi:hypothetical protein [Intestinirhabdus alba]|jgi:hypothetical protein|uniref:hypothetical protein n=1 Tax=Intestinirhabdus alba TaxID=2899544 RepID=UPI001ADF29BA|nr:hypothetical protein [Intestinirhabdus alba]
MQMIFRPGIRAESCSPWHNRVQGRPVYHLDDLMAMLRLTDDVRVERCEDEICFASFTTSPGGGKNR